MAQLRLVLPRLTRVCWVVCFSAAIAMALNGCASKAQKVEGQAKAEDKRPSAPPPIKLHFTDITAQAGINFKHNNGAFGARLMPETTGSGVAFIDYDGDGYQDIFFANGRDWTDAEVASYKNRPWTQDELDYFKDHKGRWPQLATWRKGRGNRPRRSSTGALYRNNGDGTFTDVTAESGLAIEMYGAGVAVGDYDNDGKPDLYVTALKRNYLFRNQSTGSKASFHEVAAQTGVRDFGWSSSAAWLDYDRDGWLDLFVCHYVQWSPAGDVFQTAGSKEKIYSSPQAYAGQVGSLYRNRKGRFDNVSAKAGIVEQKTFGGKSVRTLAGKGLGVAICDYNNDGWLDILVANDMEPNFLFENNKDGTFREVATQAGIAYSETGDARAGMGIDTADIDHTDRESVVIGNFNGQMLGLYHNRGGGLYVDIAPGSEVGRTSYHFLTFGLSFVDADNDSWPDIFVANGHVQDKVKNFNKNVTYAQRPLLFRNRGRNSFEEIGEQSGLQQKLVGRGLASADIDLDGDLDVVLTSVGGAPLLLRNDGGNANNAIRLVLRGTKSNRSAIGALVKVKLGASGLRRTVRSGSSYLSQSELPLTLGLGQAESADTIGIRWPSRKLMQLKNIAANQILVVDEDKGIVKRQPLARH